MKALLISAVGLILLSFVIYPPSKSQSQGKMNFYDFTVSDIEGKTFEFSQLKGKKVMIVNTASRCGYTPQYKQLEELYDTYKGKDFLIIGFPANNFGGQEPGTNEEIATFCEKKYGVSFPMMSKISVTGNDQHKLYQWLTQKKMNGKMDSEVRWNFQKYLVDDSGNLVDVLYSGTSPLDEKVIDFIEG